MAETVRTLTQAIGKLNSLYNGSSTPPSSGEEDYLVWTDLLNIGINIWENEEGMLWNELFVNLVDAATGDKTITASTYDYDLPDDFRFPASSYVWLGSGASKTPVKIVRPQDLQFYENNQEAWAHYVIGGTPTLTFNNFSHLHTGDVITYSYYKKASALTTGSDEFEMADPMFAVYYALSELKKEEGDTSALQIATQKLEAMKTRNEMAAEFQDNTIVTPIGGGLGV